ncbi:hypothetical protein HZR84_03490 [Hyphobacterium sp. CCMP332]|nr:hypothetical protein HZR84_03490 [Hyphobacterium sp. CCMP332]
MNSFKYPGVLSLLLCLAFISISCKKDKEPEPVQKTVEDNGLTKDINDLVPADVLAEMENLGMIINRGGTPPPLNGIFLGSKFILKNSNIPEDFIGYRYPDFKVQFTSFNQYNLSVQLDYVNKFESGSGLGAFIVGKGDAFSVFAEVESEKEFENATFAYVISGSIVNDTIRDMHVANFMLDNNDNPNLIWIENGEGRILYDKDGDSERIQSL